MVVDLGLGDLRLPTARWSPEQQMRVVGVADVIPNDLGHVLHQEVRLHWWRFLRIGVEEERLSG